MKKSLLLTSICLMLVTISFAQVNLNSSTGRVQDINTDFSFKLTDKQYDRIMLQSGWLSGIGDYLSLKHGGGNTEATTYGFRISDAAGFDFGKNNFNTSFLKIKTNGYVGIGTTTPGSKLHITNGNSGGTAHSYSDLTIEDDDHTMINLLSPNNKIGYYGFSDTNDNFVGGIQYHHNSDKMEFRVNNHSNDMVINNNGNVGIGTSSPTEKLEVNGTIKSKSGIFEAADTQAAINSTDYRDWGKYSLALAAGKTVSTEPNGFQHRRFEFFDYPSTTAGLPSGSGFNINGSDGKGKLSFYNFDNGDTRLVIKSNEDKFIAQFGDYSSDKADNNTGSDISFLQMFDPNSRIAIGTYLMYKPEHEFIVRGSGWFEHEIITDSKVGIGVQAADIPADYQLAVAGKVISEEVKVQLQNTWPDYVFDNNYKLPTLLEVENHIKTKGHLQNIPSAAEVSGNGIHLGEMNAKLLEKIEELTLYTIAQEKQLQEQKDKNENLETRLAKLEALLLK